MCPYSSIYYFSNITISYSELVTNFSNSVTITSQVSNFYNLLTGQFGLFTFFAAGICAMLTFIKMIIRYCVPSQIVKRTAVTDTIPMASLHPWWARADKGKQYKTMHIKGWTFPVSTKRYCQVSSRKFRFQYSLWPILQHPVTSSYAFMICAFQVRPYLSLIRNFIPRKSRNRFPNFIHAAFIPRLADNAITFYGLETEGG